MNLFQLEECEYLELSLLDRYGYIHRRSGLNWGQREGREPNQAYIPVPQHVHAIAPHFFPQRQVIFTIHTDDRVEFDCVMAQDNRKAIHTTNNNSILGRYFRERLGVPLGTFINYSDLINYGRTDVRIYKIDNNNYFMDFSI